MSNCAVILAGGEGKRMKSNLPKPMSEVLGKPMLKWVLDSVKKSGIDDICIVKGYKKESIEEFADSLPYKVETVFQSERLGTGHAVMMAKDFLQIHNGNVLVLNGDAPFMDSETISDALALHTEEGCAATVISAEVSDSTGYGRIIRDESGKFVKIVEQKDASEDELAVKEVNSGAFWFDCQKLLSVLGEIKSNNKAGEYYLPDALKLLIEKNEKATAFTAKNADTVLGANDPEQLRELNEIALNKGYEV
ncbi:MAG: NTP transferase domain-containing protein [Ruminococcus sp.]|nr:NTP transferase domain-containing protein [Ruminococcus sp.]